MPALVTVIIKPYLLDEVKSALRAAGVTGLTVSEVQGFGRQGGKTETFRGTEYRVEFIPKVRVEVVVPLAEAEQTLKIVTDAARTGKIGDGKAWITVVERLMRIRTGEMGEDAV